MRHLVRRCAARLAAVALALPLVLSLAACGDDAFAADPLEETAVEAGSSSPAPGTPTEAPTPVTPGSPSTPGPADQSAPDAQPGASTVEVTLGLAHTWRDDVGGLALTFTDIEDSRCPTDPGIACVWSGDAVVTLSASAPGADAATVELHSNPTAGADDAAVAGYRLRLTGLAPERHSLGPEPASAYRVTLTVTRP
ncbi:MAG: hypothetical protein IRZ08_04025 [Frankia sp.]|nr:hypothetical protein [Frankia sp.]